MDVAGLGGEVCALGGVGPGSLGSAPVWKQPCRGTGVLSLPDQPGWIHSHGCPGTAWKGNSAGRFLRGDPPPAPCLAGRDRQGRGSGPQTAGSEQGARPASSGLAQTWACVYGAVDGGPQWGRLAMPPSEETQRLGKESRFSDGEATGPGVGSGGQHTGLVSSGAARAGVGGRPGLQPRALSLRGHMVRGGRTPRGRPDSLPEQRLGSGAATSRLRWPSEPTIQDSALRPQMRDASPVKTR